MKKIFVLCSAILLAGCFSASSLWADNPAKMQISATLEKSTLEVSVDEDLNFGTIIPQPNSKIRIKIDATGGAATDATVETGNAAVTNAQSGKLIVNSGIDAEVTLTYAVDDDKNPGSTGDADQLEGETTNTRHLAMKATDVKNNSTPSPVTVKAGEDTEIHIGGVLAIPKIDNDEFYQTYSGKVTITVAYK